MDPIQLPEDLSSLSDEQVAELRSTTIPAFAAHLRSQVAEHREAGTPLPAELTASIATLQSQSETLAAEATRRVEAAADTNQSFDLADTALEALAASNDAGGDGDDEGEGEGEGGAELSAGAEGGGAGGETTDPAPPAAPAASLSASDIAAIAAGAAQAVLAAQPAPAPAPAPTVSGIAAQLASLAPAGVQLATAAPAAPGRADGQFLTTSAYAMGQGVKPGVALADRDSAAVAMAESLSKYRGMQVPAGVREFVPILQGSWTRENAITADAEASMPAMVRGVVDAQQALVASGQCCTPLSPMYEFCRLAVPQNPVESCLPSVQAPRGGIRYIVTPDWRQAFAAVDEQCCGDNDDPDNPVLKACSRVECPELEDETVCAVSWCAEFDNLQSRTFPELIDNYMEDLAVAYAIRKEVHYLDRIHGASTAVTGFDTGYGASLQFFYNLALAAVGYRKRNRMRDGATLNAMVPAWVRDNIKADHMLQAIREGSPTTCLSDAQVNAMFACWGVSPCWYVDSATGQDQAFDIVQAAGDLNAWPESALVYLFSPGTFVRLDGGTLDIGLVRDSLLTRRNDFQLFFEEWIGLAQLCPESVALEIPVCPNGAAPDLVAAFACA